MTDTQARAERYWEGRWRDEAAENDTLKAHIEQLETERGTLRGMYNVATQRNQQLKALLTEAADDIAQTADSEHKFRNAYPDIMRRYCRDMDLPNRIRAALNPEEST
tara:strand:- start:15 stop:335 length:321 start_codon:yes stop_codon:yes gene_type:complete